MDIREQRDIIGKALQEAGSPENLADGALLTNWVLVAEYVNAPDGNRWLSRFDSEDMTVWLRTGMLRDALDGSNWEPDEAGP